MRMGGDFRMMGSVIPTQEHLSRAGLPVIGVFAGMRENRFAHVQEATINDLGSDPQELDTGFVDHLTNLQVSHQRTLPQDSDYVPDHCRSSVERFFHS